MDGTFAQRLANRVDATGSALAVGIDPVVSQFSNEILDAATSETDAIERFARGVLESVAPVAAAVKPQSAFFEAHGSAGVAVLERVCAAAQELGLAVILDVKRGDIGSTAEAYARGLLGTDAGTVGPHVDAITVSPYLGTSTVEPFRNVALENGKGLFVLARTSNPGGGEVQLCGDDQGLVYEKIARRVEAWNREQAESDGNAEGYGSVGLVAGATMPKELREIRALAPRTWLLVPGIGAQGGDVKALEAVFDSSGHGGIVNAARSIIYAKPNDGESWTDAVTRAAHETRDLIESIRSAD